jgi:hypothetical protein
MKIFPLSDKSELRIAAGKSTVAVTRFSAAAIPAMVKTDCFEIVSDTIAYSL